MCQNRRFLKGNRLFCARTVGFCEEMTIYSKKPLELETKKNFKPKNPLRKETKILNFQKNLNPQKKNSPDSKKSITFEKLSNRPLQDQHFFSLATISTPPLQKILEKQKAQPDQKLKSCYSSPKSSSKFGSVAG